MCDSSPQHDKMEANGNADRNAASRSTSIGQALHNTKGNTIDASLVMTREFNWASYIAAAPKCVQQMATAMRVVADPTARTIFLDPPMGGFKHLRHDALTAATTQINLSVVDSFQEASNSMHRLSLSCRHVTTHFKQSVQLIYNGLAAETAEDRQDALDFLPNEVEALSTFVENARESSQAVVERFDKVQNEINELLVCTTQKETTLTQKQEKAKKDRDHLEKDREYLEEMQDHLEDRVKVLKDSIQTDEKAYEAAFQSQPGLLDKAKWRAIDLGRSVTSTISSFFPSVSDTKRALSTDSPLSTTYDHSKVDVAALYSKHYRILEKCFDVIKRLMNTDLPPDDLHGIADELSELFPKIERKKKEMESAGLGSNRDAKHLLDVVDKLHGICKIISGYIEKRRDLSKSINKNRRLQKSIDRVGSLLRLCDGINGSLQSCPVRRTGVVDREQEEEEEAQMTYDGKVEKARRRVIRARAALDASEERCREIAEQRLKGLKDLKATIQAAKEAEQDIDSLAAAKDLLRKEMQAVSQVREQWTRLVSFFTIVSTTIDGTIAQPIQTYLKDALTMERKIQQGRTMNPLFAGKLNAMSTTLIESSQFVHAIECLTGTYFRMSQKYFLPAVAQLPEMVSAGDDKGLQDKYHTILELCTQSIDSIVEQVHEDQKGFHDTVTARKAQIREAIEAVVPALKDPKEQETIDKELNEIRTFTSKMRSERAKRKYDASDDM